MISAAIQPYRFGNRTYDLQARSYVMGVLNITPDSFSDGGKFLDPAAAVERGIRMAAEGADFIDIGGESTRPGSDPLPEDEELQRVLPVIEQLASKTDLPISIDTYKSGVAGRALEAGASIVNDISGLHFDPSMAAVVSKHGASVVLMHINGTPKTMQKHPVYGNLIEEICSYLKEGISLARESGIEQIIVDPGIGFGKTMEHNLEILRRLAEFRRFELPVLIGPSRKAFLGKILDGAPAGERLEGTLGAVAAGILHGASIVRVHDVKEVKRLTRVIDAVIHAEM